MAVTCRPSNWHDDDVPEAAGASYPAAGGKMVARMSSYTALWSRARVDAARRYAPSDFRFDVLFGGPHQSLASLRRAGVRVGDWVYPVQVRDFALHVLGRMKVARVLDLADFATEFPDRAAGVGHTGFHAAAVAFRPELSHLAPTCTSDAALGQTARRCGSTSRRSTAVPVAAGREGGQARSRRAGQVALKFRRRVPAGAGVGGCAGGHRARATRVDRLT